MDDKWINFINTIIKIYPDWFGKQPYPENSHPIIQDMGFVFDKIPATLPEPHLTFDGSNDDFVIIEWDDVLGEEGVFITFYGDGETQFKMQSCFDGMPEHDIKFTNITDLISFITANLNDIEETVETFFKDVRE